MVWEQLQGRKGRLTRFFPRCHWGLKTNSITLWGKAESGIYPRRLKKGIRTALGSSPALPFRALPACLSRGRASHRSEQVSLSAGDTGLEDKVLGGDSWPLVGPERNVSCRRKYKTQRKSVCLDCKRRALTCSSDRR